MLTPSIIIHPHSSPAVETFSSARIPQSGQCCTLPTWFLRPLHAVVTISFIIPSLIKTIGSSKAIPSDPPPSPPQLSSPLFLLQLTPSESKYSSGKMMEYSCPFLCTLSQHTNYPRHPTLHHPSTYRESRFS